MVSVIVPAFNAAGSLPQCLRALQMQNFPGDEVEIIVVDDGSTDETAALAESFGVKVIRQNRQGLSAARNAGALQALGEILLFTDAACIPVENWINSLVQAFNNPEVAGARGGFRTGQDSLIARFAQLEYQDRYDRLLSAPAVKFIDGYSAAYRKAIFIANNGFDPHLGLNEDQEFSFRLASKGYKMVFIPQAQVYNMHSSTLSAYFKRKFTVGYWKSLVLKRHPDRIAADSYTPTALKLQLAIMGLLMILLIPAGFYGIGLTAVLTLAMLFILSAIPFMLKIAKLDSPVMLVAVPLLATRAVALGAGLISGLLASAFLPVAPKPVMSFTQKLCKRLMDIISAVTGLIICSPLMAIIAILIKLDSKGPVIFKQLRVGYNGENFTLYKFRTMVADAELQSLEQLKPENFEQSAIKNIHDPRITRCGKWLRRASLDELPQFFNILKGEMSLVGPRPEKPEIVSLYNDTHRQRLAVKPGLTGPMQVSGRGILPMERRLELELDYINNYSLVKDIVIILKTFPAVFSGKGAY